MQYIAREPERKFMQMDAFFKVVLVTGAGQVGKTTMLKHLAEGTNRTYISLYDLMARELARKDENMQYITHYDSPLGGILLAADETGLTGLWFDGGKYYADHLDPEHEEKHTPVLEQALEWLTVYFSGREPHFCPPVHMTGTPFQLSVWNILRKIPYGKTVTYGEIAKKIAEGRGLARMSAQAVGGAVGHNKISIIVPCHRVVGANGNLTGYAGGIERKVKLLSLEKSPA